jgi:hypothetical protein
MDPEKQKTKMEKYNEMVRREIEEEDRKDTRQFYDRGDFWLLIVAIILFFAFFGKGCVFILS